MKLLTFSPRATTHDPAIVVERILHQEKVEFFDVMLTNDNPYAFEWAEVFKNIQMNYEKMRQTVLQGGYDKVWVVESDTIPPVDALSKLLEVDAPVVTGLYGLRHGAPVPNLMKKEMSPGIGAAMSWDAVKENWGKTIEVSGGCMGCVLIDRSALESFCFTGHRGAPDVPLMQHCWENGIKQMARLDVVCGHVKSNGDVIWPDKGNYFGYRIEKMVN